MKAFQFLQELGKRMSGRNRQGGTGNIESLAEIKLPLDVLFLVMDLSDDQTLHTWALVNKQLWKLSGHVIDTVLDERMLLRIAERIQSQPFVWHGEPRNAHRFALVREYRADSLPGDSVTQNTTSRPVPAFAKLSLSEDGHLVSDRCACCTIVRPTRSDYWQLPERHTSPAYTPLR